jgi:hypothetical protein
MAVVSKRKPITKEYRISFGLNALNEAKLAMKKVSRQKV